MAAMQRIAKRHELLGFLLLANILSWVLGIVLALQARGWREPVIPFSLHYLYAFGPTIAAIVLNVIVMVWAVVVVLVFKPVRLSAEEKHIL